jgi:hypothetical protein
MIHGDAPLRSLYLFGMPCADCPKPDSPRLYKPKARSVLPRANCPLHSQHGRANTCLEEQETKPVHIRIVVNVSKLSSRSSGLVYQEQMFTTARQINASPHFVAWIIISQLGACLSRADVHNGQTNKRLSTFRCLPRVCGFGGRRVGKKRTKRNK